MPEPEEPDPSQPEDRLLLDLDQFESLDQAIEKAEQAGRKFMDVGRLGLQDGDFTVMTLFFMSALSRAQGLHDAIVREIRHTNPHAVFPLMRSYAETSAIILYVTDHPDYVSVVQRRPEELPKGKGRKSMQAILNHAKKRFGAMKEIHADLSEITHFGSVAAWASMRVTDHDSGAIQWTSYPRWRNEEQALIACAQALELAQATQQLLLEFAHLHLLSGLEEKSR